MWYIPVLVGTDMPVTIWPGQAGLPTVKVPPLPRKLITDNTHPDLGGWWELEMSDGVCRDGGDYLESEQTLHLGV